MATKTADKDTRDTTSTGAKSDTKTAKVDRSDMTVDQQYEGEQRERAEQRRDLTIADQERRVGLTPQELAIDDAKRLRDAEGESRRWDALSQTEKNAELDDPKSDHYEPLPPWQTRLESGKVFDARMNAQAFAHLLNTDGTTPGAGERQEAMRFLLDYMTSTDDENKTVQKQEERERERAKSK